MTNNVKSFCGSCGTEWQSQQAFCTGCGTAREGVDPAVPSADEAAAPVVVKRAEPYVPPQASGHIPPQVPTQAAPQLPQNVPMSGVPASGSGVPGWAIAMIAAACVLVLAVGIGVSVMMLGGEDATDATDTTAPRAGSGAAEGGNEAPAAASHPLGQDATVVWAEAISHDVMVMEPVHAAGDRVFVLQEGVTSVRDLDGKELYTLDGLVADVRDGKVLMLAQAPSARFPEALALVAAADGKEIWSRDLDGMTPGTAKLTQHGAVMTILGEISVFDLEAGDPVWSKDAGAVEAFSRSGDVLVALGRDAVRALDVRSGKVLVEKKLEDPLVVPGVAVTDDVLVASEGMVARAWDLESGKELWQEKFDLRTKSFFTSPVTPYELPGGAFLLQGYDDESGDYENRVVDADGGTGKKYPSDLAPYLLFAEGGEEYAVTGHGEVIGADLKVVAEAYGAVAHVPGGLYVYDDTLSFFAHGKSSATWDARLGSDAGEGRLQGAHLVDGGVLLHWRERIAMVR